MNNKQFPNGWWILPAFLLMVLLGCALLVALLLSHAYTSDGGAFAVLVITFVVVCVAGLLALRVLR